MSEQSQENGQEPMATAKVEAQAEVVPAEQVKAEQEQEGEN